MRNFQPPFRFGLGIGSLRSLLSHCLGTHDGTQQLWNRSSLVGNDVEYASGAVKNPSSTPLRRSCALTQSLARAGPVADDELACRNNFFALRLHLQQLQSRTAAASHNQSLRDEAQFSWRETHLGF